MTTAPDTYIHGQTYRAKSPMNKLAVTFSLITALCLSSSVFAKDIQTADKSSLVSLSENNMSTNENKSLKINITVDGKTVSASLIDNSASRDLVSRLPLEITLEDFNNTTEKIFYPKPSLNLNEKKNGIAPVPGDITIYEPWQNVAIFCKSFRYSEDLIKIGHIDGDGIELLKRKGNVKVTLSK